MSRLTLLYCALLGLLLGIGTAKADEESWNVRGRVVDQEKLPVPNVDVSTWWNAKGISGGQMETLGAPAQTDGAGRFTISMSWRHNYLLAIDEQRKRGAIAALDPRNASSTIQLELGPLVRLCGVLAIEGTQQDIDCVVVVRMPRNKKYPLSGERLVLCSSLRSRFEFLLPPGRYVLEAESEHASRRFELSPFHPVELHHNERVKDCGTLTLKAARPTESERIAKRKKAGNWVDVDHRTLFGQLAPKWHAVDSRGIPKDVQTSDFKGKWVLVYFWGTSCVPCLGKGLPALMDFYEAHKACRDQFEVVGFCIQPELRSMRDLDRILEPIIASNWGGKPLPFPVMLDNTLNTMQSFGVNAMGETLLIDPAGRLIQGDATTLAERLTQSAVPKQD